MDVARARADFYAGQRRKKCDGRQVQTISCNIGLMTFSLTESGNLIRLYVRFASQSGLLNLLPRVDFLRELRGLQRQLVQIALEACSAEEDGVPLGDAVLDFEDYPRLARFHAMVMSLPLWPAPPPLARWLDSVLASPELPVVDAMRTSMLRMASDNSDPFRRTLARVLLFEGIALNLRVLQLREAQGFAIREVDDQVVGHIAAATLYDWLAEMPADQAQRPYERMVNLAGHYLLQHAKEMEDLLRELDGDARRAVEARALAEDAISKMSHPDAAILRNELGPVLFDEPKLSAALLRERLPEMPASDNALQQRLSRLRTRARQKGLQALRSPKRRILDILFGEPAPAAQLPREVLR